MHTDHGSLALLSNFKQPEGQVARWIEKLQEYEFEIVHRPGHRHKNVDALSRLPCNQCGRSNHLEPSLIATTVTDMSNTLLQHHSATELRNSQLADPSIAIMLPAIEKQQKPTANTLQGCSPEVRRFFQPWDQLEVRDGLLWRKYEDKDGHNHHLQLVVPTSLRPTVLHEIHAGVIGGHFGQDKTLSCLKERFYWPGHWTDVNNWCHTCATCATRKTPSPRNHAELTSIKAGYPMQIVATDILGPLPVTKHGNAYLLVATDYFTRWVEAYPIPNQEASTVANKLTQEMFFHFSPPEQLHSDQGRQFESTLIAEVCKLLQIQKTHTTPYNVPARRWSSRKV